MSNITIDHNIQRIRDALDEIESAYEPDDADVSSTDSDFVYEPYELTLLCEEIVNKHRMGAEWQKDALELIYNVANKICLK